MSVKKTLGEWHNKVVVADRCGGDILKAVDLRQTTNTGESGGVHESGLLIIRWRAHAALAPVSVSLSQASKRIIPQALWIYLERSVEQEFYVCNLAEAPRSNTTFSRPIH